MRCLRKLFHIKWKDRIPDMEVLQRVDMLSIYAVVKKSQLILAGHMCRMSSESLPTRLLYSELKADKHSSRGQKCYEYTLKVSLKCCGISPDTWQEAAQAGTTWHGLIDTRTTAYEEHKVNEAIQKCLQKKKNLQV